MSTADDAVVIDPIETFIFTGLQQQFTRVFKGEFLIMQSSDKKQLLVKRRSVAEQNKRRYPFGFLIVSSINPVEDGYSTKAMVLAGNQVVKAADNLMYRAVVMPVLLSFTVEAYFNSFRSMIDFSNSWMFAPKLGLLHFNVNYGSRSYPIQVTPSTSLSVPVREAELDAPQEYLLTSDITVRGFMSRSTLMPTEIPTQLDVKLEAVSEQTLTQAETNKAFWSFNREQEPGS